MRLCLAPLLSAALVVAGCSGGTAASTTGGSGSSAPGSSGTTGPLTFGTGPSGTAGTAAGGSSGTTGPATTSASVASSTGAASTATATVATASSAAVASSSSGTTAAAASSSTSTGGSGTSSSSGSITLTTGGSGSSGTGTCTNASCDVFASTDTQLYKVDPTTLAETLICTFGGALTSSDVVTDIAIASDGTLYAITETGLYTVALASGTTCTATLVAALTTSTTRFVCLAFLVGDTLLAGDETGNVYTIAESTGAVTMVGAFGGTLACSGDMVGIDDANHTIYASAVDSTCTMGSSCPDQLVTLNPASSYAATIVGSIGYPQVYGLGYWAGELYGFTHHGGLLEIDPTSGAGTVAIPDAGANALFSGGATTPLAPVETH